MLLILLLFYNLHIKRNTFTSAANIHNLKDLYEKQFTTVLKKTYVSSRKQKYYYIYQMGSIKNKRTYEQAVH